MEIIQRAKYGPNHHLSHEVHDKTHLSAGGDKTLCGLELNEMWFITGNTIMNNKVVTCKKCLKLRAT